MNALKRALRPRLPRVSRWAHSLGRVTGAYDNLATSREVQALIWLRYQEYRNRPPDQRPPLRDVGFRRYSQFEEDGLLLYLFAIVGTTSRVVVELCAGDGRECMAANLLINHGWQGFLFDGDAAKVEAGRTFYAGHPDTLLVPPVFERAWITKENVNETLADAGVSGAVDLLSLDIDGMDYWVWEALEHVRPRLCVIETSNAIPSELALVAPYDPEFCAPVAGDPVCRGASLAAFVKLATRKGYRLVGAHAHGFNALFMRDDVGTVDFPEVSVESCHDNEWTRRRRRALWETAKHWPWITV